ncbi:MAG TPA: Glu/Leu/Phe/Val dehydrogenase dimerization domain-containing protein [Acidimicrobiales bacterium]|nr:Glu/Leu/Phe/Val dehydrogenase dimerization domain-containing protein [Acidimicrobiales bacterium]
MRFVRLSTVDAVIAFDLDDVAHSAGGTRLAADVSEHEAALLARAMTYKFGVLGVHLGGAKAVVRSSAAERDDAIRRYCEEIRPLVEARTFLTGADLGTSESDFASLRTADDTRHPIRAVVDGIAFEDLVTGFGVAVACDVACGPGGLQGRSVAIEGFGKVGGGVAREVVRRGGRVVAVSTVEGCIADPNGLDIERLWSLRAADGDAFVHLAGVPVSPAVALFSVECDVLVPGARTGVIDEVVAASVQAPVVVPASNVPYTRAGLDGLRSRGVGAHADFVCNSGGVLGYRSSPDATPRQVLDDVGSLISAMTAEAMAHAGGPFAGAVAKADAFLRTWLRPEQLPGGPPLA